MTCLQWAKAKRMTLIVNYSILALWSRCLLRILIDKLIVLLVGFLWSTSTVACKIIRNSTSLQTIKSSCNTYRNICVNIYYVKISTMGTMSTNGKNTDKMSMPIIHLKMSLSCFFPSLSYITDIYKIRSPSNSMVIICLYELSRLEIESSFLSLNFWMSNKMNGITGTIFIPTKY